MIEVNYTDITSDEAFEEVLAKMDAIIGDDETEADEADAPIDFDKLIDDILASACTPEAIAEQARHDAMRMAERERSKAEQARQEAERERNKCHRCAGKGIIVGYYRIAGGRCFSCNGSGKR